MVMTQKKILIVEDNELNRAMLAEILEGHYATVEAGNGKEALEILRRNRDVISLVLLDVVMPVMDGYTFLDIMMADERLSLIPVIVMTQTSGEDVEVSALSHGATDFVPKPYRPQVILHRIASILHLQETAAMVNQFQYDRLTRLYSKEFFFQKAQEVLVRNPDKEYNIVCSNIVNFKLYNDTFGIPAGDRLLKNFAAGIKEYLGEGGIAGRYSADRFVCLQERGQETAQRAIFERSLRNGKPDDLRNVEIKWGIYEITDRFLPMEYMCDRAMLAADSIKGQYNRTIAVYDDTLRKQMLREQSITSSMESALANNQFAVYFQPKYRASDSRLCGAEALVRWIHPEWGFMSPGEFIPLFEKNGFISRLDQFVWERTCQLIRQWQDKGYPPLPVSVNVSRADIFQSDLAEILTNLVKKYGIDPKLLHLEITETAYTENSKQIISMVDQLRARGFIIEMDDFGSGYSSLNMLSKLPIDILKLDMKFIQNEGAMNRGRNILSFVISLARWMNLTVNAEGVENEDQVERLRGMDCNYVQGFYFARPMPSWQFAELLLTAPIDSKGELLQIEAQPENLIAVCEAERPKGCMMIVDDIKVNRSVLKNYFSADFNIVEAKNGAAAMEYIKEHPKDISIILLDLVMPVMDGFQVLKTLKEDSELCDIPVVVTSQYGEGNEARAIEMGALDYLSKPYNEKLVVRRVYNALASATLSRQEKALGLG